MTQINHERPIGMNVKNIILAAGVAAAIGGASSAIASEITFTGEITDVTCSISGGNGTNGSGSDFVVNLNSVSATDLPARGATAGDHIFSINVGGAPGTAGDCGSLDGKTAKMGWSISQASIDPIENVLKNSGTASGVGIELMDGSGSVLNLADPSINNAGTQVEDGTAELTYAARYKNVGTGSVSSGTVQSTLQYTVIYN